MVKEGSTIAWLPLQGDRWAIYDVLEQIARQAQPKAYLEIGVSRGDSLKVVLSHSTPDLLVLADSWGGESGGQNLGSHAHITDLLNRYAYYNDVIYLDGDSHETIPNLMVPNMGKAGISNNPNSIVIYHGVGDTRIFDLIAVDGDHSDEGAAADLRNIWPLLKPGGYVVFDDVAPDFFHPGLLKVWDDFCAETGCVEVYRNMNDVHPPHTLNHGVVVGQKR